MTGSTTAISVEGLTKHFYEEDTLLRRLHPTKSRNVVRAVDGVNFTVAAGETLGLVGESGCGKSTLARAMLRLIEPTDGDVHFDGSNIAEMAPSELRALRSDVQMIFQDPFSSLNPRYTVKKTLVEPMETHDVLDTSAERVERAAELLERVGLSADHLDRYPHEFSGGQRQRIAIARALSVEPRVIVADEPVSGLDVSVQAQIMNLLEELQSSMELTMIFISHDLSVIRRICDRVAVMYLGEIVERGPVDDLFADPQHPYTQVLVSSIPIPDPSFERETVSLSGDVPTPIDPPSGCRFHPRCPKVIQPPDWDHGQVAWRRVLQFKTRVEEGEVNPEAMREQLASQTDESIDDQAVIDELYEEHLLEGGMTLDRIELPEPLETRLKEILETLQEGSKADALAELDRSFTTVCETTVPKRVTAGNQAVTCHLHDDSVSPSTGVSERD